MQRIPRFGVVLAGAAVLAALLLASSATGRSQTKPSNQQEPSITSKIAVVVGATLTASRGSWDGTPPVTYSYQWLRCNDNAVSCKNIANANATTYTIVNADRGHTLRFQVTAKNSDGKRDSRVERDRHRSGEGQRPGGDHASDGVRQRGRRAEADRGQRNLAGNAADQLQLRLADLQRGRHLVLGNRQDRPRPTRSQRPTSASASVSG